LRAVLDVAGGEEAAAAKGSKLAAKAAVKGIEKIDPHFTTLTADESLTADKAAAATKQGYKVLPSMQTKADPGLLQKFSGKVYLEKKVSKANQENTNKIVRQSFGLAADAPLTKDTMAAVRAKAGQDYDALKSVSDPNIKPTQDLYTALDDAQAHYTGSIRGGKNTPIAKIVKDLKKTTKKGYTIDQAINETKTLKAEADKAYAQGDKDLGKSITKVRTAVEDSIEQHLIDTKQDATLVQNFRDARKTYAQSYSVESALDGAGNVDARKLANQLSKNKPLTGNLKTAGEFGGNFPKVAQTPKEEPYGSGLIHGLALATGHVTGAIAHGVGQAGARLVTQAKSKTAKTAAEVKAERSVAGRSERYAKKAQKAAAGAIAAKSGQDDFKKKQKEALQALTMDADGNVQ
jgi:hypothetical protein